MNKKNLNTAYLGLYLAFALILSYIESLIPFYFGIPGMKLGLTNLIIIVLLYEYSFQSAFMISIARIFLSGFLFGNFYSILYSLAGGILSLCVMYLVKKTNKFHFITVSIIGAVMHNLGQLLMAYFVVKIYQIFYYAAVLIIFGVITGALIGICGTEFRKYILKTKG